MLTARSALFLTFFLVFACGAPDVDETGADESDVAAALTVLQPVATLGETRLRAGGISVWVAPDTKLTERALTLRFRTSRSLESVLAFVPDDAFGTARLVGPRTVEVELERGHELNTMASGLPLFVHLRTTTGAFRDYDVRLDIAPRLADFRGAATVRFQEWVRPVLVRASELAYRVEFSHKGPAPTLELEGHAPLPLFRADRGRSAANLSYETLVDAAGAPLVARSASNAKEARVTFSIARAGLTREDVYHVFAPPACNEVMRACILEKGVDADDVGECGDYRPVQHCRRELSQER